MRPIITEKAVMLIESQNTLTFQTGIGTNKEQMKREIEEMFSVKVESMRVMNKKGKKYAYVKLNAKTPAIDIATKLGMI
ncbi:MAG: 50S ribosomal protein L23 [Nanoarchaeota archaeon]|nr:50S ribosomal protein L23 [Nanoarchaeota archaeon]